MAKKELREEIEHTVMSFESLSERSGGEWFHLEESEREVFDIDPRRWPRMAAAWNCYQSLIDIVDEGPFSNKLRKAERKHWPALRKRTADLHTFAPFAMARVGLTKKEAHAVFFKVEFWYVRTRLMFSGNNNK